MDTDNLSAVLDAVVTWAFVGFMRWKFPEVWRKLDKQKVRLAVVALVAIVVAVISGLAAGLGAGAIAKGALTAFVGAIALRETTKMPGLTSSGTLDLSRKLSIRTEPPEPDRAAAEKKPEA